MNSVNVQIIAESFSLGDEYDSFVKPPEQLGGVAIFVGLVRDFAETADGLEAVLFLEIEHYPEMAMKQLTEIAKDAQARFDLRAVRVIHRYGILAAGEPIVLVMTAAAHRKPAIQACDYIMDWLKSTAPFWKLEGRPTGQQPVEARAEDHDHLAAWQGRHRSR